MAAAGPALCVVTAAGSGRPRYLCYCEGPEAGDEGGLGVCVTDAAEMWATSFSAHSLAGHKSQQGLTPTENYATRFRDACEQQTVSLTLQDDGSTVSLQLPGGPSGLTFELPKLPDSEARPRLQALMLELAERVRGLERRLADVEAMAASPRKKSCLSGQKLFMPDSERRRGGSGPGTRKRMPGESLINPGFKSKKAPSGVDFDDS
ncbi:protein PAXX isoform X1 [Ornithorhynchus anatinus]|uniref:protein PAXX isoform X1 n=1 Tax=Ornithorhynchus anatinus TaxID=9258 RepID=UPI0019D4BAF1|nr:protein PAXX isoform X1 [Ornithorhynchus anatinus]